MQKTMLDKLTNIPNLEALNEALNKAKHPKLFLIDIKDFKKINLALSDDGGDFILQSFAKALNEFAEAKEMLSFRAKDDEFALVKDISFDLTLMENLIFSLSDFVEKQSYSYKNKIINIDTNIGICLDQTNLLKKATFALELSKNENQPFVTYSQFASNLLDEDEQTRAKEIQKSIQNGDIAPFYQRVINLENDTIYDEALIRLLTKNSIQSPKFFIDIAKKQGFYEELVKELVAKLKQDNGKKAINVGYEDLKSKELFSYLIENFKNTNTIFELQNDGLLESENILEILNILKNNKIDVCLDNIKDTKILSILEKGLISFVKVHGNIIRLLSISQNARDTCKDILNLAKKLGAKTIATHINADSSLQEAKKIGFDYFQGFFFGQPIAKI